MGTQVSPFEVFYDYAYHIVTDPRWSKVFQVSDAERDRYGRGQLGDGLVLAKNLLKADAGTRFVYISESIGGNGPWDFHAAIYDRTKPQNLYTKCLEWDQAFTALLQDLAAAPGHEPGKTLLDETIIVSTGEFGRTPNFNTGLGRDHYDKTFTSLLVGGGIKGQRVIGKTNDDCSACIDNGWNHREQPQIDNLVATIYSALGIDWRKKIENTPSGRAYHYVQSAPIGSNMPDRAGSHRSVRVGCHDHACCHESTKTRNSVSLLCVRVSCFVAALIVVGVVSGDHAASRNLPAPNMVLIPAGEFWMGRTHTTSLEQAIILERDRRDDQPAHKIHIDAFYLDKYEVTNADYARFVEATGAAKPWHWPGGKVAKAEERWPVSNVNWAEADGYCRWAGKRLPSEAEWERAARGGLDRKRFPWGDEGGRGRAHTGSATGPTAVGRFQPTTSACTTWRAMSGSGPAIGTSATTTRSARCGIRPGRRKATTRSFAAAAGPKARR